MSTILQNLFHSVTIDFYQIIYTNSVRTSQEILYVSATEPNRLMLLRETVAVIVRTIRNTQIHSVSIMQSVPHRKHITSPLQSPTG
jgi:hypothetical protein